MRRGCRAGVVLYPWGVRKFLVRRREPAGEGYKNPPNGDGRFGGLVWREDLFQTVGLGAEAVDLGFVGGEDDIDVADVAEIGAEHDIEAVALAVG